MSIQHLINPSVGDKQMNIEATLNDLKVHAIRLNGADAAIQFQAGNITCTASTLGTGSFTLNYSGLTNMPVISAVALSSGNLLCCGVTSASNTSCQLYCINSLTQALTNPTSIHIYLMGN